MQPTYTMSFPISSMRRWSPPRVDQRGSAKGDVAAICRSEFYVSTREEQVVLHHSYVRSRIELDDAQLAGRKVLDKIISIGNEKSTELACDNDRLYEFVDEAEVLRFQIKVEEVSKAREAIEAAVSFVDFYVTFHRMNAGLSASIDAMPNQ
jgi:hypothetical protein